MNLFFAFFFPFSIHPGKSHAQVGEQDFFPYCFEFFFRLMPCRCFDTSLIFLQRHWLGPTFGIWGTWCHSVSCAVLRASTPSQKLCIYISRSCSCSVPQKNPDIRGKSKGAGLLSRKEKMLRWPNGNFQKLLQTVFRAGLGKMVHPASSSHLHCSGRSPWRPQDWWGCDIVGPSSPWRLAHGALAGYVAEWGAAPGLGQDLEAGSCDNAGPRQDRAAICCLHAPGSGSWLCPSSGPCCHH